MDSSCKSRVFNIMSIIMVSMLVLPLGAFASNNKARVDSHSEKLEINAKSDGVPQKVKDLTQQQSAGHAKALNKQSNAKIDKYELGEAFKTYKFNGKEDNSYYYPVIKDDKIVYTLAFDPKNKDDLNKSKEDMNYSVKISNFIAKGLDQIKDKNPSITALVNEKGSYSEEDGKVRLVKATSLPGNVREKESTKTVPAKLKQELKNTVTPTKVGENETTQEDQI